MGSLDQGNSTCADGARFNGSTEKAAIPGYRRWLGQAPGPVHQSTEGEGRS